MIAVLKKGETYKAGGVFPFITIPIGAKGEEKDFNDFQWWAPTDKWNAWLKANPRSWQAESETSDEDFEKRLYEALVEDEKIDPKVLDFESFKLMLEDKSDSDSSASAASAQAPSDQQKKNFTKLTFAFNKLKESGAMKSEIETSMLKKGSEYAIVCDLPGNEGNPVPESRQAYRTKIISELPNGVLAKIDESIPFGKFTEGDPGNSFLEVAADATRLVVGGLGAVAVVGSGIKLAMSYAARSADRSAIEGGASWLSKIFGKGASAIQVADAKNALAVAGEGFQDPTHGTAGYYKDGIKQLFKGKIPDGSTLVKVGEAIPGAAAAGAGGAGAAGAGAGAAGAGAAAGGEGAAAAGAAASNPVGWIIAAAVVTAATIQRVVNFTSNAQAPRLGQIEDEGWARDEFMPGTIADGEAITICWTQSAGNNWFVDILWNEDTRTTMDLIKIGNFNGKAIFLMAQINSKEYDAVLKSKEMILLSFDQNAKFERGFFDNDDLEFEMIAVEKGETKTVISTIFQGYCEWSEMESAFKGSDDEFVKVPENAPEEYSFHYKYGKNDRDVNVTGTLVKDIGSLDVMKSSFDVGSSSSNESESTESYEIDWKNHSSAFEILSFSEFFEIPETPVFPTFEAEGDDEDVPTEEDKKFMTKTENIAAYLVTDIQFADKAFEGQELPDLKTFIVPDNYLEASDNEPIVVQPVQAVTVKYPRKGNITVETEEAEEPVPVEQVGATGATGEASPAADIEGGVPVEVTKDEVKVKFRDNPQILNDLGIPDVTKIKDKDKDDKIKFLDFITPEEKEKLGMEDFDFIKKVKITKDGEGNPIVIRFKSGGIGKDRKKVKIKSSDENFDTALKVAERILAGFKEAKDDEED